jgi:thiol-disulfide isomerase/thioredoxin
MKKALAYLMIIFALLLSEIMIVIIITTTGFYGFHYSILTGIFLFGLLTIRSRKRAIDLTDKWIRTGLIGAPLIGFSVFSVIKPGIFIYAPPFLFGPFAGIMLALAFERLNQKLSRYALILVPLFIGAWIFAYGAKFWQHYVIYQTFASGETLKEAPKFSLRNDSITLTNADFKGKITVLYFWDTSCTYCLQKFPELKKKSEAWAENENVVFYAVNCPIKSDTTGQAKAVLKNWEVGIPSLIGPDALGESYTSLGIRVFPTTIVLEPSGKIVFWGDIERIDKSLNKEQKKFIAKFN